MGTRPQLLHNLSRGIPCFDACVIAECVCRTDDDPTTESVSSSVRFWSAVPELCFRRGWARAPMAQSTKPSRRLAALFTRYQEEESLGCPTGTRISLTCVQGGKLCPRDRDMGHEQEVCLLPILRRGGDTPVGTIVRTATGLVSES